MKEATTQQVGMIRDSLQQLIPDASYHADAGTLLLTQCNSFNQQRITHNTQLPSCGLSELKPFTQKPDGASAREAGNWERG